MPNTNKKSLYSVSKQCELLDHVFLTKSPSKDDVFEHVYLHQEMLYIECK
jgi:hypothetical protein